MCRGGGPGSGGGVLVEFQYVSTVNCHGRVSFDCEIEFSLKGPASQVGNGMRAMAQVMEQCSKRLHTDEGVGAAAVQMLSSGLQQPRDKRKRPPAPMYRAFSSQKHPKGTTSVSLEECLDGQFSSTMLLMFAVSVGDDALVRFCRDYRSYKQAWTTLKQLEQARVSNFSLDCPTIHRSIYLLCPLKKRGSSHSPHSHQMARTR